MGNNNVWKDGRICSRGFWRLLSFNKCLLHGSIGIFCSKLPYIAHCDALCSHHWKIRQKWWETCLTTFLTNPVFFGATTLLRYCLFYAPQNVIQTRSRGVQVQWVWFFYWVINKAQNEYKVHFSILSFFRVSVGFLVLEASCITLTMICMIRDDVKTCHSWPDGHSWQVLTSSLIMQIMVAVIQGL